MFKNTKVIRDFIVAAIKDRNLRKKYAYGNKVYTKEESRQKIYEGMQMLSRNLVRSAEIELTVIGKENLEIEGPVLYIASHKSVFDIVILLTIIEKPVLFIGKKELKKTPCVHEWFDSMGCIYIDREDKRNAFESIIRGIEELKSGQSIVLFPEGTRRMDNEIGHFKEGSFKLATKTQVPIIPIALSNTYQIFEEHRTIKKASVKVNIGRKIETVALSKEQLKQLPYQVEESVKQLMKDIT